MKRFAAFAIAGLMAACGSKKNGDPGAGSKQFISGVYTTSETGRFSVCWDTLVVAKDKSLPNLYRMVRISVFQKTLAHQRFPTEKVRSEWTGIYDDISHVMSSISSEGYVRFHPESNQLEITGITYTRTE